MWRVKLDVPMLMLSAYSELAMTKLSCVDAFLNRGKSWSTVASTMDRLLNLRFPFFRGGKTGDKHQRR